jgi:hypothetical protein
MFLTNLPLNRHESSCMLLSRGGQFDRAAKPGVETSNRRGFSRVATFRQQRLTQLREEPLMRSVIWSCRWDGGWVSDFSSVCRPGADGAYRPTAQSLSALTPAPFSIAFVRARKASISHLSFPIDGHCFTGL